MSFNKLEKLEELFPFPPSAKIIEHKIARLTAPGENYGSLIVAVDITLQTPNEKTVVHTVAKLIPPNKFIQQYFNTPVTFRNEIFFYKSIIPTLQEFQRQHSVSEVIDIVPRFYGGRLSLDPTSDQVDDDAALLLENLKVKNYVNLDRFYGFSLEETKLVLKDVAHLHAVSLALRLQQPEVFAEKIQPYLIQYAAEDSFVEDMVRKNILLMEEIEGCQPYLERIRQAYTIYPYGPSPELFATVTHCDCWVNNIMIQVIGGKATDCKLVDFQICGYSSAAKDVLFFLFTSVINEVLAERYDDLMKFYHETFISVLEELNCATEQFSFAAFEKEMDYVAKNFEFYHVTTILWPIMAPKGTVKDVTEFSLDDIADMKATDIHKAKLSFVVKEFAKRNWI